MARKYPNILNYVTSREMLLIDLPIVLLNPLFSVIATFCSLFSQKVWVTAVSDRFSIGSKRGGAMQK